MSYFSETSRGSDASSSPRDIPARRPECSLTEILSFNSWNDEVGITDFFVMDEGTSGCQRREHQQHYKTAEDCNVPTVKHSSPMPIYRSNANDTNDFDSKTSTDDVAEADCKPLSIREDRSRTVDSMADWSFPAYPTMSDIGQFSLVSADQHGRVHDTPVSSEGRWTSLDACTDDGAMMSSWVELPRAGVDKFDDKAQFGGENRAKLVADAPAMTQANTKRNGVSEREFSSSVSITVNCDKERECTASTLAPTLVPTPSPTVPFSRGRKSRIKNNACELGTDAITSSYITAPGKRVTGRDKGPDTAASGNVGPPIMAIATERDAGTNARTGIGTALQCQNASDAPALLSPAAEDDILAHNSWTDLNDEHLNDNRLNRNSRSSQATKTSYPWSELLAFNSAETTPSPRAIQETKPKLKEKFMAKFQSRRDTVEAMPATASNVQTNGLPSKIPPVADNSFTILHQTNTSVSRVPLTSGYGPGRLFVTDTSGTNGLYPILPTPNADSSDTIRTKLQSAWNNVKYGWTMKVPTHFSEEKPLFLLGKCYHSKIDESLSHETPISSIDKFRQDFGSRFWCTYRREFEALPQSALTTDCGWGCMLRTGQMMLAEAFLLHFLGRDWNWYCAQTSLQERHHRQIVRWFLDSPKPQCPFSIHNLVKFGSSGMGKKAGDWYGPASIAQILSRAMEDAPELNPALEDICVYVAHDCTLYIQDILDLCTKRYRSRSAENEPIRDLSDDCGATWRSVVILIPVRLGGETMNSIYIPCIKSMLSQDCCLGVMGGKPRHSLYFVGWQDDKLIYLDPHYCHDCVNINSRDFPLHTYHCMSPRKISFSKMDPSCTIGFYCRTRRDFDQFIHYTREAVSPPLQKSPYPMFIFTEGRSSDVNDDSGKLDEILELHTNSFIQSTSTTQSQFSAGSYRPKTMSRTSEEFVLL